MDAAITRAARDLLVRGTSGTVDIAGRQYFLEVFAATPRLVIVGAVQIAMPLVRIARELGYSTVVTDGRASFATKERFPDADLLVVGWPDDVAEEIGLGPADAVAILTHDVKFDEPAIVEALRRGCRYVGAIGSRKTQAERRARLLATGVGEADLARLRGPIGLDLGGRGPAETALAVMAEVVAERYGGSGAPLRSLDAPPRTLDAPPRNSDAPPRTPDAPPRSPDAPLRSLEVPPRASGAPPRTLPRT